MLFSRTSNTKHPIRPVDRRDPNFVDMDQEEILDKKADHTEEVWRERKINGIRSNNQSNKYRTTK